MAENSLAVCAKRSTTRKKAPVLQLVPRPKNPYGAEMIQGMSQMLKMADAGEIVGIAYVAIRPGRRVTVGAFGAADHEPSLVTHWLEKLKLNLLNE